MADKKYKNRKKREKKKARRKAVGPVVNHIEANNQKTDQQSAESPDENSRVLMKNDKPGFKQQIIPSLTLFVGVAVAVIYFCQLRTMQQTLKIDQRAWVSARSWDSASSDSANGMKLDHLTIFLTNTGKTPALDVVFKSVTTPNDPNEVGPPNFDAKWADRDKHIAEMDKKLSQVQGGQKIINMFEQSSIQNGVIAPNANFEWHLVQEGEPATWDIQPTRVIYILGRITYYDIFREKTHTTNICIVSKLGTSTNYMFCPTGNSMD